MERTANPIIIRHDFLPRNSSTCWATCLFFSGDFLRCRIKMNFEHYLVEIVHLPAWVRPSLNCCYMRSTASSRSRSRARPHFLSTRIAEHKYHLYLHVYLSMFLPTIAYTWATNEKDELMDRKPNITSSTLGLMTIISERRRYLCCAKILDVNSH